MRVMIVEDEPDHAHTLATWLRAHHFEVEVCLHSPDCLRAVEKSRPDILLTDLVMPRVTGFDIAQQMEYRPDLRPRLLVAIAGRGEEKYQLRALEAGFDYCLIKPVDLLELVAVLRNQ